MKRTQAVQTGADQLFTAERAVARALRETSLLAVTLLDLRDGVGLSPTVGGSALTRLGEAQAALFTSHAAIVATHSELDAVKVRIGCGQVRLGGGMEKDPEERHATRAVAALRSVREAA